MTQGAARVSRSLRESFFHNVAWSWLGVGVNVVIGLLLSPIIIRRLGVDQYGLWVLLFSTIEYLRMLDFGFRAAVVNATARYRARQDWDGINRTIATGMVYFFVVAVVCCAAAIALRGPIIDLLQVPPVHHQTARLLIVIIALAIALRLVLAPLTAALEGFQRFDLVNRAYIVALALRATASLSVLLMGYGLVQLAIVVLIAHVIETTLNFVAVRQTVPVLRFTSASVRWDTLKALFDYGRHSAVWIIAFAVSIQAPMTVLGYLRGPLAVGFFALPLRLLYSSIEMLTKAGDVTSSVTAEIDEARSRERVWRLAVLANRHSLALFMPIAVFLLVYGTPLLSVWVSEEIAVNSGPLLPVMLINFTLALAGQYNAGAVLLGQGKHAKYAYANVVEVVLSTTGLFLVVPQFGILGAAWVLTVTGVSVRGVYLAVLLCRVNGFSVRSYIAAIYPRPLLAAAPVVLLAFVLRETIWPGDNWFQLVPAGLLIAATYFAIALFFVIEDEYRQRIVGWLRIAYR